MNKLTAEETREMERLEKWEKIIVGYCFPHLIEIWDNLVEKGYAVILGTTSTHKVYKKA